MFAKKSHQPPLKSLIALGTFIQGCVTFCEGLRIDGAIEGDVQATREQGSLLVVSETAEVRGAIHADHIIINGHVLGPVYAYSLLEIQSKARIDGDVYYKSLEMQQGALISGKLNPMLDESAKDPLKLTASKPSVE